MIYLVTLAFTKPEVIERTLEVCDGSIGLPRGDYEHILLDQHYPLPDKRKNACDLADLACYYEMTLMRPYKNLGLHEGANFVCSQVAMNDSDIYIGIDHDAWPTTHGWGRDLVKVMQDPSIAIAMLWNKHAGDAPGRTWREGQINGVTCREADNFAVNGIGCYSGSFLKKSGGFSAMVNYWGHVEQSMWEKVKKLGLRQVYLSEHFDDLTHTAGHDQLLTEYKWDHAHHQTWPGDFESWLKMKGRI